MSTSAIDFAFDAGGGYPFGVTKENAAKELRAIADRIDAGEIIMQSARVTSLARVDDYATTGVRLVFVEKKNQG